MARIAGVRVATCVAAAALVGAAAATLPTEARAEDGPASSAGAATSMPAIDGAALAGEASAAVETAVSEVVDGAQATATSSATPAGSSPSATDEGTTASVSSPTTSASAVPLVTIADTTADPADTSRDIAEPAPAAQAVEPQPAPSAAQTLPNNLNVSVRIGSAGDNGPVTQMNVAAATPAVTTPLTGAAATASTVTSGAKAGDLPPRTVSAPAPATSSTAPDDEGTWTWQWNCLSAPDLKAISPGSSTNGSIPKNWTWTWNCGSNSAQYQKATSTQYQPSNVNVSIRISSPGNDGPVTQANVAAALGVATGVSAVGAAVESPAVSSLPLPQPETAPTLPGVAVLPGLPSLPEVVALAGSVPTIGDSIGAALAPSGASIFDAVELPFVLPLLGSGEPSEPGAPGLALTRVGLPGTTSWLRPVTLRPGTPVSSGAVLAESAAGGRAGSEGSAGPHRREAPALRWKAPPSPQPLPMSLSSGTSAAPATGGGSSSGGIPIFLALPFLAAMLDLARRVVLDGTAVPSGHRSRMPDDPG